MDLFKERLYSIRKIASKLARTFNARFEVDELISAAWVAYDRAIKNNPGYVHTKFAKESTFFFRVKMDMKDYIREETKLRVIQKMEKRDLTIPTFTDMPYSPVSDRVDGDTFFEPTSSYNEISTDDYELLNYMLRNTELSDRDHCILQCYYIDNMSMAQVGKVIGISEGRVSTLLKDMYAKMRKTAEVVLV